MEDIKLPDTPGVYIFRDSKGKPIYVGKAINLKNRVSSYFANKESLPPKTKALVEKIDKIDYVKTGNEIEALLLEADLIKRYKPPYNISLKDDKYYKYIKIEKNDLPVNFITKPEKKAVYKISTSRKKTSNNDIFLGPYPDGASVNLILRTLRKVFPYRDCSNQKFNRYMKTKRPCLYGHIGLCPAPCQSMENIFQNNQNIKLVKEYIKGDRKKLFNDLELKMKEYSKNQDYEKAAIIRDQIQSHEYLSQTIRDVNEYIDIPTLIDDTDMDSLKDLIEILNANSDFNLQLTKTDFVIEVFDISNIQGTNPVGSMVVITNGSIDKKKYRKFRINKKNTPDDFAMMKEMLERRFNKDTIKGSRWEAPDLVVIDGGKGQLSSALEIINLHNPNLPVVGLAKRFETIIIYTKGTYKEINLPKKSPAINLLIKGRDEAHRFAVTYHRKLRKKQIYG